MTLDLIKKWFYIKKDKKQTISFRNNDRHRLCRWSSASCKYVCSNWILAAASLEQVAEGIGFYMNTNRTEYTCFKQEGSASTLNSKTLKWVNQFTYLGRNILSTEGNVNICIAKAWIAIGRLLILWKFDLSEKIKLNFFQALAVSLLQYGCTARTLMKYMVKKLNVNNARMLCAVLKKSWK